MTRYFATAAVLFLLAACTGDDDPRGGGVTPAELEGSWYAGRGGTTAPYDPATGSWGMPSGSGLVYVFEPGGHYIKAYQSYESAGGCTTGFTAFENGDLAVDGATLVTHPTSGHMVYRATCSPELDSDTPLEDLVDETFTWSREGDTLLLRRDDGAEATFTRL
jgi:hypothetical protein